MRYHPVLTEKATRLATGLRAEVVLGVRLATRHPVSRAALAWAVGLAALTRSVTGPVGREEAGPLVVALAGLLAAAAGSRPFVRGGAFASLRWVRVAAAPAVAARIGGSILFAGAGAVAAAFALGGTAALRPAALLAAALHACIIAAFAGALVPAWGCSLATILPLLLVAAGAGSAYASPDQIATRSALALRPPGALIVDVLDGQPAAIYGLGVWVLLAVLGLVALVRRASTPSTTAPGGAP